MIIRHGSESEALAMPLPLARSDAARSIRDAAAGGYGPALARAGEEARSEPLGEPVTLGTFGGFYHPGRRGLAVLMLSPIGYEEMCTRSTWRSLAAAIAAKGLPCLRFDYPGTGDALDPETEPDGVEDWRDAIRAAAIRLKALSGTDQLALLGQGLGATLAIELAPELGADAVVAMAPVDNGRHYLRELAAWSRIVADAIGVGPDPLDENGLAVAGIPLPASRAAAIKAIRLDAFAATPAGEVLVVERQASERDAALGDRIAAAGANLTRLPFDGYETLLTDPTQARPPVATIGRIAAWLAERAPERAAAPRALPAPAPLLGNGFEELAGRFGAGGRLFGVLCRPAGIVDPPTLVFANAGHDYHVGWARLTVELARTLALEGIASLRFDLSGIGDSPAHPGSPAEVLYSDDHVADVVEAAGHAARLTGGPIILAGRCSGSYAALQAAVRQKSVAGVVMINTLRFLWDADEDVATAVRYGHRSVGNFGATLLRRGTLMRLVRGELNVGQAGRHIARAIGNKAGRGLAPLLGRLSKHGRMHRAVHRNFRDLEARGARVAMLYADDDPGLAEFRAYFGEDGKRLAGYRAVTMVLVGPADHNFTHRAARDRLIAAVRKAVAP